MAVRAASARTQQARGLLFPSLSVGSDVHTGAPNKYASTDAFFRALGEVPIYSGGELRAGVAQADAELAATSYGYRMSVRDVDRTVRADYARVLRADATISFRQRALARLQAYYQVVQARRAAGLGVGTDLLRTGQRLLSARADVTAVVREQEDARMALNNDLGRIPDDPLNAAPLPAPEPLPDSGATAPWNTVPDVAQSDAVVQAATAQMTAARAGRKLHLSLEADMGAQPYAGSTEALLNSGQGAGGQVMLVFSLPFFDGGIYRGRLAEANANLQQAQSEADLTRRTARLNWTRAAASVRALYDEYTGRTQAATAAQDAYLEAESLYRGGQGSTLDVLDAYDAWVQAQQDQLDAVYGYWVARADLIRWGTP